MIDIKSMDKTELKGFLAELGEPSFRVAQIFRWLHVRMALSFEEMTDLSKPLRDRLKETAFITSLSVEKVQESRLDGTKKYLFRTGDGNLIEAVRMRYDYGDSVCISTQVGCRMGCAFCASTLGGLIRNLTPSEMLEEVYAIEREQGSAAGHIVLMGSGEPFDNYANVVRFLRLITDPDGRDLGVRHITVSTSGLTDKIVAFANEGLPVTLALSLHAADQTVREKLLPIAKTNPIGPLLDACDRYFEATGRRVTYEYAVVKDVNDSPEEAKKIADLLKKRNAHINLIPVNPVRERNLKRPERSRVVTFQKLLEKYGINATIRRELGTDIDGACGQLRAKTLKESEKPQ